MIFIFSIDNTALYDIYFCTLKPDNPTHGALKSFSEATFAENILCTLEWETEILS